MVLRPTFGSVAHLSPSLFSFTIFSPDPLFSGLDMILTRSRITYYAFRVPLLTCFVHWAKNALFFRSLAYTEGHIQGA
jgi:hypothetical protein